MRPRWTRFPGTSTPAAANMRAFLTMAHGDRRAIDRLVDSMRTLSEHQIWPVASAGAQYARELDGAARLLRLMLEAPHRDAARYAAASLLSHIELTRGRGDAAVAALSVIPNVPGRVWSIGKRALLSVAPNGPTVSPDLLVALRDSLRRWEPRRASPGSGSLENEYAAFDLQTPRFAEYAIGLLSIKLGDLPDAERAAAALDTITGTPDERATARALALGLRAHMADAGGNATKALQLLEAPAPSISLYHLVELTLFPRERYLRARLLERAGRTKEALEWYASIGQGYPGELGYMGVATDAVKRLTAPR